jgi:hypothetical protein
MVTLWAPHTSLGASLFNPMCLHWHRQILGTSPALRPLRPAPMASRVVSLVVTPFLKASLENHLQLVTYPLFGRCAVSGCASCELFTLVCPAGGWCTCRRFVSVMAPHPRMLCHIDGCRLWRMLCRHVAAWVVAWLPRRFGLHAQLLSV